MSLDLVDGNIVCDCGSSRFHLFRPQTVCVKVFVVRGHKGLEYPVYGVVEYEADDNEPIPEPDGYTCHCGKGYTWEDFEEVVEKRE